MIDPRILVIELHYFIVIYIVFFIDDMDGRALEAKAFCLCSLVYVVECLLRHDGCSSLYSVYCITLRPCSFVVGL
jgi:hypothetical protein